MQSRRGFESPIPRWSRTRTSDCFLSSRRRTSSGVSRSSIPERPGPPASQMTGGSGRFAREGIRTNASSIMRGEADDRFSGTAKRPSSPRRTGGPDRETTAYASYRRKRTVRFLRRLRRLSSRKPGSGNENENRRQEVPTHDAPPGLREKVRASRAVVSISQEAFQSMFAVRFRVF